MIEIRALDASRIEDFFAFFEGDAHGDNPNEDRCYCINWVSENHSRKLNFRDPDVRKDYAKEYIRRGSLKGYLAYDRDRVVGWCNANTKGACIHSMGWQYFMKDIPLDENRDMRIKSIYCFAVAPHMKGKGVASQLLDRVCKDARDEGFEAVEVFPIKEAKDSFMAFMGPHGLYKKKGFTIVGETDRDYIMRKDL